MKLELDTKEKTIKIEERVNIKELIDFLKQILPNGLWKEFELIQDVYLTWNNPISIPSYPPIETLPWITYSDQQNPYEINCGLFNIEKV